MYLLNNPPETVRKSRPNYRYWCFGAGTQRILPKESANFIFSQNFAQGENNCNWTQTVGTRPASYHLTKQAWDDSGARQQNIQNSLKNTATPRWSLTQKVTVCAGVITMISPLLRTFTEQIHQRHKFCQYVHFALVSELLLKTTTNTTNVVVATRSQCIPAQNLWIQQAQVPFSFKDFHHSLKLI
jgi:hypothetical protein